MSTKPFPTCLGHLLFRAAACVTPPRVRLGLPASVRLSSLHAGRGACLSWASSNCAYTCCMAHSLPIPDGVATLQISACSVNEPGDCKATSYAAGQITRCGVEYLGWIWDVRPGSPPHILIPPGLPCRFRLLGLRTPLPTLPRALPGSLATSGAPGAALAWLIRWEVPPGTHLQTCLPAYISSHPFPSTTSTRQELPSAPPHSRRCPPYLAVLHF